MKTANITSLKQEDLAMILGVTRSQLSMYLIGKRDLPVDAKLLLAKLIAFESGTKNISALNNSSFKAEIEQTNKILESISRKNIFKQNVLQNKLDALEKNYFAAMKTTALITFLKSEQNDFSKEKKPLYDLIKSKAENVIQKYGLTAQIPLIIELESLKTKEVIVQKQFSKIFSDEQKL